MEKSKKLIKLGVNGIFQNRRKDNKTFLCQDEKTDQKILRLKMKLQNFPNKRLSLKKPLSIKPLVYSHQLAKFSMKSLDKFDIVLSQDAISRPYPALNLPKEPSINLSFSEKHRYWRNKSLDQYRNCKKNTMRASSLSSQCSLWSPISNSIRNSTSTRNSILSSSSKTQKNPNPAQKNRIKGQENSIQSS